MSDDAVNHEVQEVGSEILVAGDERLANVLAEERSLWRACARWTVIITPLCILIWIGLVALAVGPDDPEHWLAWIGIGIIVGMLAGAFFGAWIGFTVKSHDLDRADLPVPHRTH